MVFNSGRYEALEQLYGGRDQIEHRVATATGVGHDGHDLSIFCLAARGGGRPIENPRQVPSYRYSSRHGPVPPCFARATVVTLATSRIALIGGTAAVRGEDSTHAGDLPGQLEETFENLDSVVAATHPVGSDEAARAPRWRHLRAYVVRPGDVESVRRAIESRFAGAENVEVVRADVCRPELLVEIECAVEW